MNEYSKNDIRHLLDLYYEGKSSKSDETILQKYFTEGDVDDEFADDKLFFDALADANDSIEVPSGLGQRIETVVDSWSEADRKAAEVKQRFRMAKLIPTFGIAASIALLFAIGSIVISDRLQSREPVDTFTDPMDAYAETQRVLTLFAGTLEKGQKGIEIAEQGSDKAFAVAMEQLNKI